MPRLLELPFCTERRGYWWQRLALNLEKHLKRARRAYDMCRRALRDPYVRTGE